MEITINYDGRLVTVEVNAKIYEYLDRVNHKMVSEIPMISISVCVAHSLEHRFPNCADVLPSSKVCAYHRIFLP